MILVIEQSPQFKNKWDVRVVLESPAERHNLGLIDVRVRLRMAIDGLPKDVRNLTICEMPKRRSTDVKDDGEKKS